jgi:hypothetical protein
MRLHDVLPFPVRVPVRAEPRQRARPADVIPLRLYRRRRHRSLTSALLALGALLLWGGTIILGLAAFRLDRDWIGEIAPAWPWWPIW